MCNHEGRNCPGRSCRCECMNCQFPEKLGAVVACGPEAEFDNRTCEEIPMWSVAVEDDDGEPIGKIYYCRSQWAAQELARKMAADRNMEFVDETSHA